MSPASSSRHSPSVPAGQGVDNLGKVESRGIDFIPEAERNSKPRNLFWTYFGCQFGLGNYTLGGLVILLGLSWWQAFTAIIIGNAVGSLLVSLVALLGPRTGTNSSVSSGAFFGVRGRYLGSFLAQFDNLGFNILAVWPAGLALEYSAHRLFHTPTGVGPLILGMLITAVIMSLLALYGHATLIAAYKLAGPINIVVLVIYVVMISSHFKLGFAGAHYAYGPLGATFLFAITIGIVNPISFAVGVNDYARRLPTGTPPMSIIRSLSLGMFFGNACAYLFGAFVTLCFASPGAVFVQAYIGLSPFWLLVPLAIVGFVGNVVGGALNSYNATLDLHAVLWRISRAWNAVIVMVATMLVVYLAVVAYNATNSIDSFVSVLSAILAPWIAILTVGHFRVRGRYRTQDLQAFASSGWKGIYEYTNGFNIRAWLVWAVGSAAALMFSNTSFFEGPLSRATNGMDLSFLTGFVIGGVLSALIDCTSRSRAADLSKGSLEPPPTSVTPAA